MYTRYNPNKMNLKQEMLRLSSTLLLAYTADNTNNEIARLNAFQENLTLLMLEYAKEVDIEEIKSISVIVKEHSSIVDNLQKTKEQFYFFNLKLIADIEDLDTPSFYDTCFVLIFRIQSYFRNYMCNHNS